MRKIAPLSDVKIRKAQPQEDPYSLFDGGGLYLLVKPCGSKLWRFKFTLVDKSKLLSFGSYPDVSLEAARERREKAKAAIAAGKDPGEAWKEELISRVDASKNTFEKIAMAWIEAVTLAKTKSPANLRVILQRLRRDALPMFGKMPIAMITAANLREMVLRVSARGRTETARRLLSYVSEILSYAASDEIAVITYNPVSKLNKEFLPKPPKKKNLAAPANDPEKVGLFLRMFDAYQGQPSVKAALQLGAMLFARPGDLRRMRWNNLDLDGTKNHNAKDAGPCWCFTAGKTDTEMVVPLATQAVKILRELKAITGHLEWVFPGGHTVTRPMSENGVLSALRRMGIEKSELCGHGWRAVARTMLDEILHFAPHLIEHQLGHVVKDPNGRAYNRTTHLPDRREMMQRWADYLEQLKTGEKMIVVSRVGVA
ncbi:MAG: integrase arm-type DNA-binding domain-containing protein [Candidatus Ozemobacteraceae bacterium]